MALKNYRTSDEVSYGFGQFGCSIVDNTDASAYEAPSGLKVIAITFLAESTFTSLTPESSEFLTNPTATFPAGITIYGSYDSLELATGTAIVYLG